MEKKASIMLIAALAAIALLVSAMPAEAQAAPGVTSTADLASTTTPGVVIMALSAGGATGGNATFSVPYSAKVFNISNIDYAVVSVTNTPVAGSLNTAAGTGTLSTREALPATSTTDYLNRSAIPVAGTNAVIALQDLNMTGAAGGKYSFESRKLSVYLPDGTASTFTLNRPIRMTYSPDQTRLAIEADPAVAGTIAGTLASGVTFPAEAKPVMLSNILASK